MSNHNRDAADRVKEVFDNCALEYQEKFMAPDLYQDTYEVFCALVEKAQAEVLEVACGPGNITAYLLKKRPDFRLLGTDISPKMLELARVNNPSADFQLLNALDILQLGRKFDAVMGGFVLPYLSRENALALIRDAAQVLNSKGVLYLSTMEGHYDGSRYIGSGSGGDTQLFTYFHQEDYLAEGLKKHGFKIVHLSRKAYPARGGTTTDLIMIAVK